MQNGREARMQNERAKDWQRASIPVAGLILLLAYVVGLATTFRIDPAMTVLVLASASWPALDAVIAYYRGTITREDAERLSTALSGPWMAVFLALGWLGFR